MTSKAPIICPDSLKSEFLKGGRDSEFGFLQIGIDFSCDSFVIKNYVACGSSCEHTWTKMAAACEERTHTFFVTRDPVKGSQFLLVHFAPDTSPVKQRMLYASSRATLKAFLGHASFTEDYFCSSRAELNVDTLVKSRTLHTTIDFRSEAEINAHVADLESAPKSSSAQVMNNLPVQMRDSAKQAVAQFINEGCPCVQLSLDPSDQSISGTEHKCQSVAELKPLLEAGTPAYLLFWYARGGLRNAGGGNPRKRVFGYYCPDKADRKLKFTYSTCKANIIEYCAQQKLEFFARIEMSGLSDVSADYLDYHIYPSKQQAQQKFAMPAAPTAAGGNKNTRGRAKSKRKKKNFDELI